MKKTYLPCIRLQTHSLHMSCLPVSWWAAPAELCETVKQNEIRSRKSKTKCSDYNKPLHIQYLRHRHENEQITPTTITISEATPPPMNNC